MRIRVRYNEYKDNPDATQWSIVRGYLIALGLAIILILTIVFQNIIGNFIEGEPSYIIALVLAIAAEVGMVIFCSRKEKQSVLSKLPRSGNTPEASKPFPEHGLTACPRCSHPITTTTLFCPKCGYTEEEQT